MELLAKLEEANRLIEADGKSLNSLSACTNSGHSRQSSDTSQISITSGSNSINDQHRSQDPGGDLEEDLWTLWGRIVNEWDFYWKKKTQWVKELVRKGIPHHFRGIVWQLLCAAHDSSDKKLYVEYMKATSACEKVIRRDIARTYPEHEFFKEKDGPGQESLFNVMKAYSLHDREVGYCQGSGFIVGLLLMQMPEEDAFAVFVKLMQDYKMRDMFKPSMSELGVCIYQLENIVQELIPELHCHFQSQNFHTSMYASSWFLTLFTTTLSLTLACRIMDCFISEGMEVIFKIAIALLLRCKADLLCLDMEGMLEYFQKQLPQKAEADLEGLFQSAWQVKYNCKKMKKWEKEYIIIKNKEQEEMVELRKLRSENRMLKQKCELLEAESARLADRLVRGQVSRAEEEETTFALHNELEQLKHEHLLTIHRLEIAEDEAKQLSLVIQQTQEASSSHQSSMDEMSLKLEQLKQRDEMIECLQDELVKVRLQLAENDALVRDLRQKIHDLEEDKKTLRECPPPDNSVATLQEELIAVKLREAEANLSLKDLRQRVQDLNTQWQRHLAEQKEDRGGGPPADSTPKKLLFWESRHNTQRLEEELMTTRLREMETLTELKELRLKVMELETQIQVSANQTKRQNDEMKRVKEQLDQACMQLNEAAQRETDFKRQIFDLDGKRKEDEMLARIRDAENAQIIAELKQKISRLELKNEEMLAEGELRNSHLDNETVRRLHDKVANLRAEIKVLETKNKLLVKKYQQQSSTNSLSNNNNNNVSTDALDLIDTQLDHNEIDSQLTLNLGILDDQFNTS